MNKLIVSRHNTKENKYTLINRPIFCKGIIKDVLNTYLDWGSSKLELISHINNIMRNKKKFRNEAFNINQNEINPIRANSTLLNGSTVNETLYKMYASQIVTKKILPTELINSLYFTKINDSGYEIDFLLKFYLQYVNENHNILIINPSPNILLYLNDNNIRCGKGKTFFIVKNVVLAELYASQFSKFTFAYYTFSDFADKTISGITIVKKNKKPDDICELNEISKVESTLLISRDLKAPYIRYSLQYSKSMSQHIYASIPNSTIDNLKKDKLLLDQWYIRYIMSVDGACCESKPVKKSFVEFSLDPKLEFYYINTTFTKSKNDKAIHGELAIDKYQYKINTDEFMKSNLSVKGLGNLCEKYDPDNLAEKDVKHYGKSTLHFFSQEIGITYAIYKDKEKFFAQAWYCQLVDPVTMKYKKRKSTVITKGLRGDTPEEVISKLDKIVFDDRVKPYIYEDIRNMYLERNTSVSLKTLWYYLRERLITENKSYDDDFFKNMILSNESKTAIYREDVHSNEELIRFIEADLNVDFDDLLVKEFNQLYNFFEFARKQKIYRYNPLVDYRLKFNNQANKRQNNIRNVLVKKYFTIEEEKKIIDFLLSKENNDILCVKDSRYLGVLIKFFTGMSTREVCALRWSDFKEIDSKGFHVFTINKFMGDNSKEKYHTSQSNWNRFRIVPINRLLEKYLLLRRGLLKSNKITGQILDDSPIIMRENNYSGLRKQSKKSYCMPKELIRVCHNTITKANIPEKKIILPDADREMETDLNKFKGDIFLSNIRWCLNQYCQFDNGEINYMIGVQGDNTFSINYCDYSNDIIQYSMIVKMNRWISRFDNKNHKNKRIELKGESVCSDTYKNNKSVLDIVLKNDDDKKIEIAEVIDNECGYEINEVRYEG